MLWVSLQNTLTWSYVRIVMITLRLSWSQLCDRVKYCFVLYYYKIKVKSRLDGGTIVGTVDGVMCVHIWNLIVDTDSCKIIINFICYFLFVHSFESIEIVSGVKFGCLL